MRSLSELTSLIKASAAPDEPPLRVPAGPAQQEHLEALRAGIQAESAGADITTWDKRPMLVVRVEVPSPDGQWRYGGSTSLRVGFTGDELQVSDGYHDKSAPLAGLPQLRRLVARVHERLLEYRRREQKRDKLRKLKERAIEGQIDALAARHGFTYALDPKATKVELVVRLDDQNGISIDIPHKRVQEVLADLPRLLDNLRALYHTGVRFKVVSTRYVRNFRDPRPA